MADIWVSYDLPSQPWDADWLRSIGFVDDPQFPGWLIASGPVGEPGDEVSLTLTVCIDDGRWELSQDGARASESVMLNGQDSRGHVLRLADSLGIPLKEGVPDDR